MNRSISILILAAGLTALAGCAGVATDSPTREIPRYTIEQFLETTSYSGGSLSPDKRKVLVSSDETGVLNAYAFPVDGGEPRQLTHSVTESIRVLGYFPNDERILYTADRGGDEQDHIYVLTPEGELTDLTPGEELRAVFQGWSQDDRALYISTNERDRRFFDLYRYSVEDYGRTMIYRDEVGYDLDAISPDERYLAFGKARTTADRNVFLYDRQTQELKLITEHEGSVANSAPTFSPDGRSLYLLSDEGGEFTYLARHELADGTRAIVERPEWDVSFAYFSKHGKYLVVGVNEDARTALKIYEAATMQRVELPELPDADVGSIGFSRDESTMTFYLSSSRDPRNLWVWEIGQSAARQLTHALNPEIASEDLVDGQVVRFASYDGVEVPGILYKPHDASVENKLPALVWVHGGPGGQSRFGYSGMMQYLINHGYAIYAINNRGSSGYGKTFFKMDDRKHGEADLGDCIAAKQMLIDRGYVDAEKIGIIGGSYGGYMVLAALAFEPEAFDVGVDIFGVANWLRTLESIPPYWESFREALYTEMGDPATDRDRLHRISPMFHADKIVKPLLVLQGANDPRVLQIESDEMVAAARGNGAEVEYIVFPDEGHGFEKKENQERGYSAILEFLDTHLKGRAADVLD